ncbi:hypothetical protein GKC56_04095 [Neisseriaceae bacterium PsAf]|nr:hypothetical protein [Neisseriaceae bacterium PsAf]MCV2504042.1 hypothetical protein [Neisseriaceae bacterium]
MTEYDNYKQELESINVDDNKGGKMHAYTVYILYLLNILFIGVPIITAFVGFVIAWYQKDRYQGTIYHSHFDNQIKLFLYMLVWTVIFGLLCFLVIGIPLLIGLYVWQIYQIIIGLLTLSDNKPRKYKTFG